MTGEWISSQVDAIMKELVQQKINVLAICADNAANVQLALSSLSYIEEEEAEEDVLDESDVSSEELDEIDEEEFQMRGPESPEQLPVAVPVEAAEQVAQGYLFLKPVRCWAHLLQLCFKDIKENEVISNALAVALRVYEEWGTKDSKAAFKEVRDKSGWKKRGFTRPAETRWNSYIRLIVEVFEFEQLLTAVAKEKNIEAWKLLPHEVSNLRIAVLILQPLQWATDTIQKESCTVDESAKVFETLLQRLNHLRTAITGKATRNPTVPLEKCAKALLEALAERKDWFENDLIKIYRQLKGLDEVDAVWMKEQLKLYWSQVAPVTFDQRKVDAIFHPANAEHVKDDHMVQSLLSDITTLVVTEAVVERSFQKQKAIIGHTRYAMKDDVMNAVLFIKHNADKVQLLGGGHPANFSKAEKVKDKKENPNELISDLRYAEILRQLKEGLPNRPAWFSKTQIRKVEDLDVGRRIQVKFLETGGSRNVAVWHTAVIKSITKRLGENGAVERIWTVVYGENDVQDFNPLQDDWEWKLVESETE
jgi:hypothetical protein